MFDKLVAFFSKSGPIDNTNPTQIRPSSNTPQIKEVERKTSALTGSIPSNEESQGQWPNKKVNAIPKEESPARKKINDILSPNHPIEPGTRLSPKQFAEMEDRLMKNPKLLKELEIYIKERKEEIKNGGKWRQISHFAAGLVGISITANAEKLYDSVSEHFNKPMPQVDYSRASALQSALSVDYSKAPGSLMAVIDPLIIDMKIDNKHVVSFTGYLPKEGPRLPEGMGLAKFADGTEYFGIFHNGKFVEGEIHEKGSVLKGNFKDGKLEGVGTIQLPNGNEVTGKFSKGNITGKVKIEAIDRTYVGFLDSEGRLHGQVQCINLYGNSLNVKFEKGKPDAPSLQNLNAFLTEKVEEKTDRDGRIFKGIFLDGLLTGRGTIKYPNAAEGDITELSGKYYAGIIQDGPITFKKNDETTYARLENGKINGYFRVVDKNGKSSLVIYDNGSLHDFH